MTKLLRNGSSAHDMQMYQHHARSKNGIYLDHATHSWCWIPIDNLPWNFIVFFFFGKMTGFRNIVVITHKSLVTTLEIFIKAVVWRLPAKKLLGKTTSKTYTLFLDQEMCKKVPFELICLSHSLCWDISTLTF